MACPVTVYRPTASNDARRIVFYLHGGGLVYGERDDLPSPYVRAITDAGSTLVCADYPLAPETAEQLYLHPKTVRYRVERVRKIYGVDVRDPDDYLQVVLADKIYTLRKDS